MSDGLKILLVAPWGYPPQWRKSRYIVRMCLAKKTFNGVCEGCSSSVSLYMILKSSEEVANTWMLVIGSDTVVRPSNSGSVREDAEKWFNDVKKTLFNTTVCEGIDRDESWLKDIYVGVIPGIGQYYGYNFNGSIVEMFIEAYRFIAKYMDMLKPSLIVLDTTHGLNMLTIATLYATIAASIIHHKKIREIHVFNSEPYPPDAWSEQCVVGEKISKTNRIPSLNIHDVSTLQWIIRYLRALNFLEYFNEKPLASMINKKSKNKGEAPVDQLVKNIICMVEALRTGLVGLIYNNSLLSNGKRIPFTVRSIMEKIEEFPRPDRDRPWTKPIIRGDTVEYELTIKDIPLKYIPILDALTMFMGEFSDIAKTDPLKKFAEEIGSLYYEKGYWDKKQIVINEAADLTSIARKICAAEKTREISGALLKKYWEEEKKIRGSHEEAGAGELGRSGSGSVSLRNFVAHAALNFTLIDKIRMDETGENIIEIVYSYENLRDAIREVGKKSLLKICLESH